MIQYVIMPCNGQKVWFESSQLPICWWHKASHHVSLYSSKCFSFMPHWAQCFRIKPTLSVSPVGTTRLSGSVCILLAYPSMLGHAWPPGCFAEKAASRVTLLDQVKHMQLLYERATSCRLSACSNMAMSKPCPNSRVNWFCHFKGGLFDTPQCTYGLTFSNLTSFHR